MITDWQDDEKVRALGSGLWALGSRLSALGSGPWAAEHQSIISQKDRSCVFSPSSSINGRHRGLGFEHAWTRQFSSELIDPKAESRKPKDESRKPKVESPEPYFFSALLESTGEPRHPCGRRRGDRLRRDLRACPARRVGRARR